MRQLVFALFLSAAFIALPAQAQFNTEPLSLVISPQYPRPHETVLVTPRSTQFGLSSAEVVITANGTVVERGSGERTAAIKLGGPGTAATVVVTATLNGTVYTKETTIRPADVALVLEPLTTSHPLYEGGSLVAAQGPVRLVAVADLRNTNGARISSGSLTYTWRLGNKILTEESGIGRSALVATAPARFRDAEVSVTVATTDERVVGYAETTVSSASPSVRAYRTDPLLGIDLAHALSGTFAVRGEEESFAAVPFSFATIPQVRWTLNGASAGTDSLLTVRTDDGASGRAAVQYSASLDTVSGSSATGAFTLTFGGVRNSLFGL
jgi:hypothetical protein